MIAQQIFKQTLLSAEFSVIKEIPNESIALQKLKSLLLHIEYLFVDVEIPLMDGIQLIIKIQTVLPECKIIMVTSHSDRKKLRIF
jgi:two-component SAPR family response regulator